jgi:hypothetical protein
MKFDSDFKKALSQLPSEEKDKLILRLLKHDLELANRLTFELLSTQSVQERRKEMEVRVKKQVARMTARYYSPGELLMDMRDLSGEITGHVKITRDKIGEPALNLLMLNEVLNGASNRIAQDKPAKSYTFCTYVIARAFRILLQIKSLDEDWLMDFEDGLKELGKRISDNAVLMKAAIYNGLDVNWLLRPDKIPDDIAAIHKSLRTKGFLK